MSNNQMFRSTATAKPKNLEINPKFTIYRSNGSGRDGYIYYNDGGFRKNDTSNYRLFYTITNQSQKVTNINPKFPIYRSNGKGRDSYIYTTCGGFYKVNPIQGYFKNLRSYDTYQTYKKYDYDYYVRNFKTPEQKKEQNRKFKLQRATSARLARPKIRS